MPSGQNIEITKQIGRKALPFLKAGSIKRRFFSASPFLVIIKTADYFSVSGGESSCAVGGAFLMSTPQLPLLYEKNPQKSIKAETANAATAIPN
jgi:hypothetical protein